jgi:hypothetical protein
MKDRELLELAAKACGWVYLTNGETFVPVVGTQSGTLPPMMVTRCGWR